MTKEWRHRTAAGNFARVRWTPEGLETDTGNGWEKHDQAVVHCAEYVLPFERSGQFSKPTPLWWGK